MKKDLAKKFLQSTVVLGMGMTLFVSPFIGGATVDAAETPLTFDQKNAQNFQIESYDQVEVLDEEKGLSIGFTYDEGTGFTWEVFETIDPDTIIANGTGVLDTPMTITVTLAGETSEYNFQVSSAPPTEENAVVIADVHYRGAPITIDNIPVVHVGGTLNFSDFTAVNPEGTIVPVTFTMTGALDTQSVGVKEVSLTVALSEAAATREAPMTITIPVAVANPSMVETLKQELQFTISSSSTEANPSTVVTADGTVKLEAWHTGGGVYVLKTIDTETGEFITDELTERYGSYKLTVTNDLLNTADIYLFNLVFDHSTPGSDTLVNTQNTNSNQTNKPAQKPTQLAKTSATLSALPALSGLGVLGGSALAFVKSKGRKNKK